MDINKYFLWDDGFPKIFFHTSISFLVHRPFFWFAKKGDMAAARKVVSECVKIPVLEKLKEKYKDALIVPVMSGNVIPVAFAQMIGLPIYFGIKLPGGVCRKNMSGMERLIHRPVFKGKVRAGQKYIIADDIITQGGTVGALRNYIMSCGGEVSAITALACSGTNSIAPDKEIIREAEQKFGASFWALLNNYGLPCAPDFYTESQLKYLMSFNCETAVRSRLFYEIYNRLVS